MLMRAAIVTVALATIAAVAQDPAVADAATHAAAAAPEPGTLREWGSKLVEYGPIAIFVAFVISGIGHCRILRSHCKRREGDGDDGGAHEHGGSIGIAACAAAVQGKRPAPEGAGRVGFIR